MMKAYIKVKCSDELPDVSGEYLTSDGFMEFDSGEQSFWFDSFCPEIQPPYWLKEVTIPDEEEIDKRAEEEYGKRKDKIHAPSVWKDGAMYVIWLLSKLK